MTFKATLEAFLNGSETLPTKEMTFKERMAAKKAALREQVRAKYDKIDADRVQAIKQDNKQKEVDAFMKKHSAKMKEKMIEDKLAGKY